MTVHTDRTRARARHLLAAAVVVLALAGLTPTASADWGPSANIAPAGYDLTGAIVRYDGTGRAYAFFQRYVPFNNTLHLRERAPGSRQWGPVQTIPTLSPSPGSLDASVSSNGDIVVGYTNGSAMAVRRPAGGSWEPAVQYSSPGTAGPTSGYASRISVDIGADGTTVIAWAPRNSCCGVVSRWRLMAAAYRPGAGWDATPQVWNTSTQDVHADPSAAVDDTGHAVVAWGARTSFNADELFTAEWSGGTWSAPTLRSAIGFGSNNMIDADAAGSTVAIIWSRGTGMHAIVNTAGAWSPSYYLSGNQLGSHPSIAVGANDTVFATWNNQNPVANVLARRLPGQGFTQETIAGSGAYGLTPKVAANANNDIAVVWSEYVPASNGRFGYAAFARANGPLGAPSLVSPTVSDNDLLTSAAVDPWGHALVSAAPIFQGMGKALDTIIELGTPADADAGTIAAIAPSTAEVGDVVTCTADGFLGTLPFAYTYEWRRDGVPIPGATSSTFTVRSQDVGAGLACAVTADNEGGTASVTSDEVVVDATPPASLTPPTLQGTAAVGEVVTCDPGTWSGEPAPELSFDWLVNGVSVGEPADSYEITVADAGTTLACLVTASNDGGTDEAASATASIPTVTAPLNVTPPKVTGVTRPSIGTPLTCVSGTWTGQPTPVRFTDWLRDGQVIPGEYASVYTVRAEDAGTVLSCQVTGENVAGSQTVASTTSRTLDPAPANTVLPKMAVQSGSTWGVGGTGRCQRGTWTNAQTYAYQWQRDGSPIAGATSELFAITATDSGHQLSCTVTATGRMGTTGATAIPRLVPAAPTNTVLPSITGTARPGRTLTCARGTWTGATSYAYSWQRNGVTLASATNKYVVAAGDVGATVTCGVRATGPGGSTTAYAPGRVISP